MILHISEGHWDFYIKPTKHNKGNNFIPPYRVSNFNINNKCFKSDIMPYKSKSYKAVEDVKLPPPFLLPYRSSHSSRTLTSLPFNCVVEILSFLDPRSICQFGCTNVENRVTSDHPSLWTSINVNSSGCIELDIINRMISKTNNCLPLQKLSVGSYASNFKNLIFICYCEQDEVCMSCRHLRGVTYERSSRYLPCSENCGELCTICTTLSNCEEKLHKISDIKLSMVNWLFPCSLHFLLRGQNLTTIDISHSMNVNHFVSCVSENCPLLKSLSFKYIHALSYGKVTPLLFPVLHPDNADTLALKCPELHSLRFRYYCIAEESIRRLILRLPKIQYVDLSDNEFLHGFFLSTVPSYWPRLQTLLLRNCTELEDRSIATFVHGLINGENPVLTFLDLSCQWSFVGDSLVEVGLKEKLLVERPHFIWKEDQCVIPGFGVDPEAGVECIETFGEV